MWRGDLDIQDPGKIWRKTYRDFHVMKQEPPPLEFERGWILFEQQSDYWSRAARAHLSHFKLKSSTKKLLPSSTREQGKQNLEMGPVPKKRKLSATLELLTAKGTNTETDWDHWQASDMLYCRDECCSSRRRSRTCQHNPGGVTRDKRLDTGAHLTREAEYLLLCLVNLKSGQHVNNMLISRRGVHGHVWRRPQTAMQGC